jgi:predicted acylesterase/phospholipase RssA
MYRLSAFVSLVALLLLQAACATPPDRAFVPKMLVTSAQVDGLPGVRGWTDELPPLDQFKARELPAMRARYAALSRSGKPFVASMLALSGGGENGAFGAGLLVGWTEHGGRPEFELVTGVSAGALIAPFAFLGTSYDRQLSELFNRYGGSDIYQPMVLAGILGGSSVASNEPLRALVARYVDQTMMRRLSEERAKGRLLLIGTTNLDAERPVYWDIGRIAQAGTGDALELIRSVLVASSAIPGVFPPVRIRVTADGRKYEELHVDGGTTRQVFFSPANFRFKELDRSLGRSIKRELYVVRNGKIGPEWEQASESVLSIGRRALYTTIKNQALGDLVRMYEKAGADGIGYNLAAIPDTFDVPLKQPFDKTYMQALFNEGLRLGRAGYRWQDKPPGVGP